MIYRLLRGDPSSYGGIIPENAFQRIYAKKNIAFGAIEDNELVGIACFDSEKAGNSSVILLYICIAEEYRRQGVGKNLIKYCAGYFRKKDIYSMIVRSVSEIEEVLDTFEFFVAAGFFPTIQEGYLLEYNVADLIDTKLTNMARVIDRQYKVYSFMDINHNQLKKLLKDFGKRGFISAGEDVNLAKSVIFVDEGKMLAAMAVIDGFDGSSLQKNNIFLSELFSAKKDSSGLILVTMLAAIYNNILSEGNPGDKRMFVQLYSERDHAAVQSFMGPADKTRIIQEMVYFTEDQTEVHT